MLPAETLVNLAKLILENDYLAFKDKINHQKLGTAIGTKIASNFANIFMSQLEERLMLRNWLVWYRSLDDAF